jgi:hypothetical protein
MYYISTFSRIIFISRNYNICSIGYAFLVYFPNIFYPWQQYYYQLFFKIFRSVGIFQGNSLSLPITMFLVCNYYRYFNHFLSYYYQWLILVYLFHMAWHQTLLMYFFLSHLYRLIHPYHCKDIIHHHELFFKITHLFVFVY